MKNILFYISIISTLVSISCTKSYNLETNDGVENTKEKIIEAFGNKKQISSLTINTYSSLDARMISSFHTVSINFQKNGRSYFQILTEKELEKPKDRIQFPGLKIEPEIEKSFEIAQINFKEIPTKVIQAKNMIEKPEKYQSMRLATWETFVTKKNKLVHFFKIVCDLKKPDEMYSHAVYNFKIENNILEKVL